MDSDVQEIINNIFDAKNIRTKEFEKNCQLMEEGGN